MPRTNAKQPPWLILGPAGAAILVACAYLFARSRDAFGFPVGVGPELLHWTAAA